MIPPLVLIGAAAVLGVLFFALRSVEERRGYRYFADQRKQLDAFVEEVWAAAVLGGVPISWRQQVRIAVHEIGHGIVQHAVYALRMIERPLSRLSYKMRVTAPKSGGSREVSGFLKTLSPREEQQDFQGKSV